MATTVKHLNTWRILPRRVGITLPRMIMRNVQEGLGLVKSGKGRGLWGSCGPAGGISNAGNS